MKDAMCCLFILQIHENQRDLLVCLLSMFVSVKDQSEWVGLIWGISTNQTTFSIPQCCLYCSIQVLVLEDANICHNALDYTLNKSV